MTVWPIAGSDVTKHKYKSSLENGPRMSSRLRFSFVFAQPLHIRPLDSTLEEIMDSFRRRGGEVNAGLESPPGPW